PPTSERTFQDRVAARLSLGQTDLLLALPEETPVAVYCGPLEPQHGVGLLVESWRTVVDQVINARLWLVGSGPMRAELAARAEELQLYGRVATAGQFDDIDDFCRAADVFVAP